MNRNVCLPQDVLSTRIRSLSRRLQPEPAGRETVLNGVGTLKAVVFDIYGTLVMGGPGELGAQAGVRRAIACAGAVAACRLHSRPLPEGLGAAGSEAFRAAVSAEHRCMRLDAETDVPEIDVRTVWKAVLPQLTEAGWLCETPDDDGIERFAVEFECRSNPVWPMPHAAETIGRLRENGLQLGIVSNAQFFTPLLFQAFMNQAPEDIGFDPHLCVYSFQRGIAKPSQVLFDLLADRLAARDIQPGQTLYVGNDMLNDILPASRCGWKTVLFAGDRRSLRLREGHPGCSAIAPDAVLTSLDELMELVRTDSR